MQHHSNGSTGPRNEIRTYLVPRFVAFDLEPVMVSLLHKEHHNYEPCSSPTLLIFTYAIQSHEFLLQALHPRIPIARTRLRLQEGNLRDKSAPR